MRSRPTPLALAACLAAVGSALPVHAQTATTLERVEIISSTPLRGPGLRRQQVAAPVQTFDADDLERGQSLDLSEHLSRRLGSVHVNHIQGNPLQMDVSYRGYTASPLLGTPQGLSVYVDGVRMNQPFGDVVSWDLLPRSAIAEVVLMPGSNPLFGLNTLGGALSVTTKDGRSHPGRGAQLRLGSHGLAAAELSYGASDGAGWDVFATLNHFHDDGWRVNSRSDVTQAYAKLGWSDGPTRATLAASGAESRLNGNGLQDFRFLEQDWRSVYTQPDNTRQKAGLLNATLDHAVNATTRLAGNAYVRKISSRTFNADINEGSLDQSVYQPSAADQAALLAAGYSGFPTSGANAGNTPFPYWRCIAQALQQDEPGEKCNGLLNSTATSQSSAGVNAQLSFTDNLAGLPNLLVVGAGLETHRSRFVQDTQLGYLNADRTVTGVDAYADGVSGGEVDGEPLDNRVRLHGRTRTISLLFADTLSLDAATHLTVSGRYNRTTVTNRDQIRSAPDAASLDGDHRFARFNPALGLTWNPSSTLTTYASLSQSSRAPTAIELGCANPDQPCKLPNAMAGDPPLRQVVTRTLELGARGRLDRDLRWNLGVFRADNRDDILFVADDQTGFGYFKNFGRTRRQGLEAGLSQRIGPVQLALNYTWLDATFRSAEAVLGAGNSSNEEGPGLEGTIEIEPGSRIPMVPRHIVKAAAEWQITPEWTLNADWIGVSGTLARGNENGEHQPDGTYYLGKGGTGGYGVLNLGGTWQPLRSLRLSVQVLNLFDRRYATAAQLGATGFNAAGGFVARPFPAVNGEFPLVGSTFYAPGAPRSMSVALRYDF